MGTKGTSHRVPEVEVLAGLVAFGGGGGTSLLWVTFSLLFVLKKIPVLDGKEHLKGSLSQKPQGHLPILPPRKRTAPQTHKGTRSSPKAKHGQTEVGFGPRSEIMEFVFLGIFTIELLMRVFVCGKKFFSYTTEDFSWTAKGGGDR